MCGDKFVGRNELVGLTIMLHKNDYLPEWEGLQSDNDLSLGGLPETLRELEMRHGEGELPFYQGVRLGCLRRSGF